MFSRFSSITSISSPFPASYIVRNGLVVQLEGFTPGSYPGSGSTWFDIAGNFDAALTANAGYDSAFGGIIKGDGVGYIGQINDAPILRGIVGQARTAIIWARISSYQDNNGLFGKQFGSVSYDGYSFALKSSEGVRLQLNGNSVNGGYNSATGVWSLNTWTMFSAVIVFGGTTIAYVNTTEVINVSNGETGITNNTANLRIGTDIQDPGDRFPTMDVGAFYFYGRGLSPLEIAQNFNMLRGRYGV